ncbi:hypothetical protein DH2020_019395 [Rehmannia glutinosa]|uniref:Pectinesterase catalytic domain-containing protein n=1 Tax=Rehmannia glutinosa TaxID=99300 RepID=A0ABR0WLQ2_REHGL
MDEVNINPSISPSTSCNDIEVDVEFPPTQISPALTPDSLRVSFDGFDSFSPNSISVNAGSGVFLSHMEEHRPYVVNWHRIIKIFVAIIITIVTLLAVFVFLPMTRSKTNIECTMKFTVSKQIKSDFKTISEAIEVSPSYSPFRVCIYIQKGEYHETVTIGDDKNNISLIGEGIGRTIISSNAGSEEPDSPLPPTTLCFLAHDLTVVNTAKYGVAVKNWAKYSVFFRCRLQGVDATLSIRAQKQFYCSCQLYSGNNSISGIARAFFQKCEFRSEKSYPEEKIVFSSLSTHLLTFESRFVFHLCSFYVD